MIASPALADLDFVNYYSPRNAERPRRASTQYIILHTTEAARLGSLRKVHEAGETHLFVDEAGRIYRIIEADRVALHCGRSMWNGRSNLDACSIGIEVVGYYNREITQAQYAALAGLLARLQKSYGVSDDRVLTHCMVAYGAPNRWHPRSHRGRKRCGMLFARQPVRRALGLGPAPGVDPDVAAGRLVAADPYLAQALYGGGRWQAPAMPRPGGAGGSVGGGGGGAGDIIRAGNSAWDIARDQYAAVGTTYVLPDGRRLRGSDVKNWGEIPVGTRVVLGAAPIENADEGVREIGRDGRTAQEIAGAECAARTTIYFLPDGRTRRGDEMKAAELAALGPGVKMLVGYVHGGYVTGKRSAFQICGSRWDFPSTYYRFPDGTLVAGNCVREGGIPMATMVFYRK
jgi:hypothetical protein